MLTEQGKSLCEETVDHVIRAEMEALGSLSAKEQEVFMNIFTQYTKQLKSAMREIPEKGGNIT